MSFSCESVNATVCVLTGSGFSQSPWRYSLAGSFTVIITILLYIRASERLLNGPVL